MQNNNHENMLFKNIGFHSIFNLLLLIHRREWIFLGSNFRNGDFDGFTRLEVPYLKIIFITIGLCVCVCDQLHYKTNYRRNFTFRNLYLCHM